jgi:hyperosmotically inducible protein
MAAHARCARRDQDGRHLQKEDCRMRTIIILGCGVLAAACASNGPPPAEEPGHSGEQTYASTSTSTTTTSSGVRANGDAYESSREAAARSGEPKSDGTAASADAAKGAPTAPSRDLAMVREPAPATARETAPATPPPGPAADNTKINERDRSGAALTPMDQGNGEGDLKITQQIRKAVMADSSLSFTAKNVKIIAVNGKVTLRGPVKTDHERQAIADQARKVAGATNVDDQLEVTQK